MSFKLLYTNTSAAQGDINVDPNLVAEAGMVGYVNDNGSGVPQVSLATSGTSGKLFGIIDENKTTAFAAGVVNELVASGQTTLAHANLVSGSFNSLSGTTVVSSYVNGTIVASVVASGASDPVSYSYYIPGKAGDDTTLASGKCTIWLQPGEFSTDIYEISNSVSESTYSVGTALYVSTTAGMQGRLTTHVAGLQVGFVTKAPTAGNPFMNFYWLGSN